MLLGRDELGLKRTWGRGGRVGERSGSSVRVLRVLGALRRSLVRVLRVWEAPGALRGSSVRVLRVLEALGGAFVFVLRVREAPGGFGCLTDLSRPKGPGGSAEEGPYYYYEYFIMIIISLLLLVLLSLLLLV